MTYSREELETMLAGMRRASSAFYRDAARIGCHPFIEFAGLMNEYIKLCEIALARGVDFTETSVHGGEARLSDAGPSPAVSEREAVLHLWRFSQRV